MGLPPPASVREDGDQDVDWYTPTETLVADLEVNSMETAMLASSLVW